jgi:hypothetical protein
MRGHIDFGLQERRLGEPCPTRPGTEHGTGSGHGPLATE